MKTSIPPVLITIALVCFGLLPKARAVVPPPPGGYPNFTTAAGDHALQALVSGLGNTAIGTYSLFGVTTGSFNTAVGAGALDLNTADSNTATGAAALLFNTTGTENTATGTAALEFNETGDLNTANGAFALFNNTEGGSNTAIGDKALFSNNTGVANTSNGVSALYSNTTGHDNTAVGYAAMLNTTGSNNTGLGSGAGFNLTTGDYNIDIGNNGVAGESNTIRIGGNSQNRAFIAGIRGVTTANAAIPVLIDTVGQLGTMSSSRRFKHEIKEMDNASKAIHALKPVTFQYKSDETNTPQFGLIAEDVAEVNPDLVVHDEKGEIYTVRYDAVNAMLLNEFLKEHRKNEEQEKTIAELKSGMTVLAATVKKQVAQIQKVSAQLEASKPGPQVAENNQ